MKSHALDVADLFVLLAVWLAPFPIAAEEEPASLGGDQGVFLAPPSPAASEASGIVIFSDDGSPLVGEVYSPAAMPQACATVPRCDAGSNCQAENGRFRQHCIDAHLAAMARMRPFGDALHSLMGNQIANGKAAQMMLYEYDFYPGSAALSPRGRRQLERMEKLLMETPFPLLIEATPYDPALAAARRESVLSGELPHAGVPVSADRVRVSTPRTPGLRGSSAVPVNEHLSDIEMNGFSGSSFVVPTGP